MKDLKDPVRYVIVSDLFRNTKMQLYFDLSSGNWSSSLKSATLFKRKIYAKTILKVLNKKTSKTDSIIKVSIKGKKPKLIK